jgi:hypothetical protein
MEAKAMVLVFDGQGNIVQDLKATEFVVKENGKPVQVDRLELPAATSEKAGQWIIVLEPIRDPTYRLGAFQATAELLATMAAGDKAILVVRDKTGLVCLTPGFTSNRAAWAQALNRMPGLLAENLSTGLEPGKEITGFVPGYQDVASGPEGAAALDKVLAELRQGAPRFLSGTRDVRGSSAIQRLNFTDASTVASRVKVVVGEMNGLVVLLQTLAKVPGAQQAVVFSRFEADDLASPEVVSLSTKSSEAVAGVKSYASTMGGGGSSTFGNFRRTSGDNGGPAEFASLAVRDTTLAREKMKVLIARTGITLHSVAGSGPTSLGNLGNLALGTGGYAFPFNSTLVGRLAPTLQAFNARYEIGWAGEPVTAEGSKLEISVTRPGLKLFAPKLR